MPEWTCEGCRHRFVGRPDLDFPCRECCRNSLNPIDRYEPEDGNEDMNE